MEHAQVTEEASQLRHDIAVLKKDLDIKESKDMELINELEAAQKRIHVLSEEYNNIATQHEEEKKQTFDKVLHMSELLKESEDETFYCSPCLNCISIPIWK